MSELNINVDMENRSATVNADALIRRFKLRFSLVDGAAPNQKTPLYLDARQKIPPLHYYHDYSTV